jgi:hypothetical protein
LDLEYIFWTWVVLNTNRGVKNANREAHNFNWEAYNFNWEAYETNWEALETLFFGLSCKEKWLFAKFCLVWAKIGAFWNFWVKSAICIFEFA